eukprot:gene17264-8827_t
MDDGVTDQPVCKRAKIDSNDESLEEKNSSKDANKDLEKESTIKSEFVKDIGPRLSESDVGIDQYVCDSPGIGGIIKQRYADFIVREIDKSGKIVRLSSIEFLEAERKYQEDAESCHVDTVDAKDETNAEGPLILEDLGRLNDFLADSKQTDIKDRFLVLSADNDKEHRKLVHMFIKKNYQDLGTKDKRAITTQQLCACRVDAKRLASINKLVRNIAVGSFEYKSFPLKLGDLSGNQFSIVLRNISLTASEELLSKIIESLRGSGFINYFGMQRFGSGSVATFEVGKAVLRSDWESVIKLILSPRPEEDKLVFNAKMHWLETGDSKSALEMMKKRRCIEGKVLDILAKQGEKSFYNSFQGIPRNTRLMYIHSYQSYIWNKIVSKRIKIFGMQPIAGDLVLSKHAEDGNVGLQTESMTRCQVKMLTEADLASMAYKITDIVIPLPGYDVTYPGFGAKEWYSELLALDGLSLEDMRHQIKEYSLSGAYRFMIARPSNISWSIAAYDDYRVPLWQTDLDVIHGQEIPSGNESGNLKALKLEFSLPTSSYATMVIREITKMDTSTHSNIELNV